MARRSRAVRCSASRSSDSRTSGSLLASDIEPETSTRKTRLSGGRAAASIARARRATRTRRCSGAHGQAVTAVLARNGTSAVGLGAG